jgi:hypothetical protein
VRLRCAADFCFSAFSSLSRCCIFCFIFFIASSAPICFTAFTPVRSAFILLINNYRFFGHLSPSRQIFLSIVGITLLAATFLALLAFVHIAFDRRLGKFFWLLTAIWLIGSDCRFGFSRQKFCAHQSRFVGAARSRSKSFPQQKIEHERHAAELRAENERRAKELEEARQLQLSMLPKKLPQLPNLEIAAYMKPATEVGGDYYDFHVFGRNFNGCGRRRDRTRFESRNGRHGGEKLCSKFAEDADIPAVFKKSSRVKEMNLRGLFMAMTMLKIKDNRLINLRRRNAFGARFSRETGRIEEISIARCRGAARSQPLMSKAS